MQTNDDIDDLKERRICCDCIGDGYLRAQIKTADDLGRCDYCDSDEEMPTITIEELASEISAALERHYRRTDTEPDGLEYTMIKEGLMDWDRHGEPVAQVIAEAAMIRDEAAEHIRLVLEEENTDMERAQMGEEGPFDEDAHYEEAEIDDIEFQAEWRQFERSLGTETRYFNRFAEAVLNLVFENIEGAKARRGRLIIRTAGPGTDLTALFRARVFQSDDRLEGAIKHPDQEVGAPPTSAAASGRMNARGISVFYGATDAAIALAEVRPPVGSRVVVGRFDILRPVRLLDVDALKSLMVEGSIFDPGHARRQERARFLRRLSARITMPVMPEDEGTRYLVTQAMADYLVSRSDLQLDGILYRSVQADVAGHNVVLFHRAARCEALVLPAGTELKASLHHHSEDGVEPDYWVWEEVPAPEKKKAKTDDGFPAFDLLLDHPLDRLTSDDRPSTLRIDTKSVTVHHVRAVSFQTDVHTVKRHRSEKRKTGEF